MNDGRCLNSDAYCCLRCKRAERAEAEQVRLMDAFNLQRKKRSEAEAERDRYRKERDHARKASRRWREVAEDAVAELRRELNALEAEHE